MRLKLKKFNSFFFCLLKALHPGDLKSAVEKYLNQLLEPIRKEFESDENKKLINEAYPIEDPKKKHK